LLKPRIMRFCVESLLKLEELSTGELTHINEDMDEEDHEALCKLFTTIGSTFDQGKTRPYVDIYFKKIEEMSNDKKNLSSRSRFMYKDLIELRHNNWVARREEEKAKTLDEIKRDFERDERIAAQQSQQMNSGYRGGGRGMRSSGRGGGGRGGRGDYRDDRRDQYGMSRQSSRTQRERHEVRVDKDGFQQVGHRGHTPSERSYGSSAPKILSRRVSSSESTSKPEPPRNTEKAPAPLTKEKLESRVKSIKSEFVESRDVKELLLSMDELRTTPDAGRTLVQLNLDTSLDCKDSERDGIFTMLTTLYKNRKLSPSDVQQPLGELIEFLGSYSVDSPRAPQYIGDIVADFIHLKALDIAWLCSQAKKLEEFDGHLIAGLIELSIQSVIGRHGLDEARAAVNKDMRALTSLLNERTWTEISQNLN